MDRQLTLGDYGRALWSGRRLILATALAAAAVGLILTFARPTDYTSTARVALGQPTTISGVPMQTFASNPTTAAEALTGDDIVAAVARTAGVTESRIRDGVSVSIPRSPGATAGNQPAVAEISFSDGSSQTARRVVEAYAHAVLAKVSAPYARVLQVSVARRAADRAFQQQLLAQIQDSARELRRVGGSDRIAVQSLLLAAQSQLQTLQPDLAHAELEVAKAKQIEQPQIIARSNRATSSSSFGQRGRTVLLAAIIGLLLGIVITFVWRGSPAGRAGRARRRRTF